jgi:cholesterol transport system auxiliary component
MKYRSSPVTFGLILIALTAAGCLNLNKSYPEKRLFVLDVGTPQQETPSNSAIVIKINKFRVSPLFTGRAMVYRVADLQYESDFYDEWFIAPGALVTQQFHEWLSRTGRFRFVLLGTNHIESTHRLQGSVAEFYGDYRLAESPKAIFGIELLLFDELNERRAIFRRTYHQEVPLVDRSPEALAGGLTQAVRLVLVDLERELAEVAGRPAPASSSR